VGMIAKLRRYRNREGLSLREIARKTGLSRNTVRRWLRQEKMVEPLYPARASHSIVDPWAESLALALKADRKRPKRDRRTALMLYKEIREQGYNGSYGRVCAFVRSWRATQQLTISNRSAFIPLQFAPGEAFQFDWSYEFATIRGIKRRLDVAQFKLAYSRVFWLGAYYSQSHEMLFDAHAQALTAFGGVPCRGIYDNMKTAVDRVGPAKERDVNARFEAMCGHYLFDPEFCNPASGWEKGQIEKSVQDRRRQIWREVAQRDWESLEALNTFLSCHCRESWNVMHHPEHPDRTLAELWEEERPHLLSVKKLFDGYVERPARVSSTALVVCARNRYSVPTDFAHHVVSLRLYPREVAIVADGMEVARHVRCFDRYKTIYDFCHYIGLVQRKPGALRNGAPFITMPEPLLKLQKQLLRHPSGDRVMVQVLCTIPVYGLEAVTEAVRRALEAGHTSGEHVLNLISRLESPLPEPLAPVGIPTLREAPVANVARYDQLRVVTLEVHHDE